MMVWLESMLRPCTPYTVRTLFTHYIQPSIILAKRRFQDRLCSWLVKLKRKKKLLEKWSPDEDHVNGTRLFLSFLSYHILVSVFYFGHARLYLLLCLCRQLEKCRNKLAYNHRHCAILSFQKINMTHGYLSLSISCKDRINRDKTTDIRTVQFGAN